MNIKDTGAKKFSVHTRARLLIDDITEDVASFAYADAENEALNSSKNKICHAELIFANDGDILRALYALSSKNTGERQQHEQLNAARLFILAWSFRREKEEVAKT